MGAVVERTLGLSVLRHPVGDFVERTLGLSALRHRVGAVIERTLGAPRPSDVQHLPHQNLHPVAHRMPDWSTEQLTQRETGRRPLQSPASQIFRPHPYARTLDKAGSAHGSAMCAWPGGARIAVWCADCRCGPVKTPREAVTYMRGLYECRASSSRHFTRCGVHRPLETEEPEYSPV